MPCYYPIDGWRAKHPNPKTGRYSVVFAKSRAQQDEFRKVPCGRCVGCRLEKSRQWSLRCLHESQLWEQNCFITLTYNDENLPQDGSLNRPHFTQFMKNLRKLVPQPIRFFGCGEYGEEILPDGTKQLGRPHFHAIIFNFDFPDKYSSLLPSSSGEPQYESKILDRAWRKGFATIGEMTLESAAYVARYSMKKINGDQAETHYQKVNPDTGELSPVEPELLLTSRNPGIAADWFHKYKKDLDKGYITFKGKKMAYPKYYDKLYEKFDDETHMFLRDKKRQGFDPLDANNALDRLRVREHYTLKRADKLLRGLKL